MIRRRELLIGAACFASASAAEALRPRRRLSLLGSARLEDITPRKFGSWSEINVGEVLQPREEGTLTAKLYSQIVGRVYQNRNGGDYVMLALAYGDTQSDLLQLHRPETCYPAFGFTLSSFRETEAPLEGNVQLPLRSMRARATGRVENVSYWTRIGEYLPRSQSEQRIDKLKTALEGFIPDGILVRCSSFGDHFDRQLAMNEAFLRQLVLAIDPRYRPAFIGTRLSKELAGTWIA